MGQVKTFIKNHVQVIAGITGTINMIADGMQTIWTIPPGSHLPSAPSVTLNSSDIALIQESFLIGGFFGLSFAFFINSFGRKHTILLINLFKLCGWILITSAQNLHLLLVGRFLTGSTNILSRIVCPLYIYEIIEKKNRRSFLYTENLIVGYLLFYYLKQYVCLTTISLVGMSCIGITLLIFPFMPETPAYYISTSKTAKARKVLEMLQWSGDVELDLLKIAKDVQKCDKKNTLLELLDEKNRECLIIVLVLFSARGLSNLDFIVAHLDSLLASVPSSIPPNVVIFFALFIMVVVSLAIESLANRISLKLLLANSSLVASFSMLLLGVYFDIASLTKSVRWAPGVLIILFAFSFRFGVGRLPIVLTVDMFPTNMKALGLATGFFVTTLWNIDKFYVLNNLGAIYGMQTAFFIFSMTLFCAAVFTYYFVPESEKRSNFIDNLFLKEENSGILKIVTYGTLEHHQEKPSSKRDYRSI